MKTIEVVAAVICRGPEVFATQRGYGEFKGYWEFPGGKVERDETREDALKREIREELNTDIATDRFLTTVNCNYPAFHLTMHCYICHVVKGKLELLEAEDSRWLDRSHLRIVNWLPADAEVVRTLLDEPAAGDK
jgi:8-oxo-dGTP diphosphatase